MTGPSSRRIVLRNAGAIFIPLLAGCSRFNRPSNSVTSEGAPTHSTENRPRDVTDNSKTSSSPNATKKHLDRAWDLLNEAEGYYVGWAGPENGSVLGVTAASSVVAYSEIRDLLEDAIEQFDKAINASEDGAAIYRQRNWALALRDWVEIQRYVIRAFNALRSSFFDAIVPHQFEQARDTLETYEGRHNAADAAFELHQKWKQRDGKDVANIDEGTYRAKVLQFETELHTMAFVATQLQSLEPALTTFETGVDTYLDKDYEKARAKFQSAASTFDEVRKDVESYCCEPWSLEYTVAELNCIVSALYMGSKELEHASDAGRDNNHDNRSQFAVEAEKSLTTCRRLRDTNPAVQRFIER